MLFALLKHLEREILSLLNLSLCFCIQQKAIFVGRIRSEQQELQAVKEANDELHQKNTELSSQASVQAQRREELEVQNIIFIIIKLFIIMFILIFIHFILECCICNNLIWPRDKYNILIIRKTIINNKALFHSTLPTHDEAQSALTIWHTT